MVSNPGSDKKISFNTGPSVSWYLAPHLNATLCNTSRTVVPAALLTWYMYIEAFFIRRQTSLRKSFSFHNSVLFWNSRSSIFIPLPAHFLRYFAIFLLVKDSAVMSGALVWICSDIAPYYISRSDATSNLIVFSNELEFPSRKLKKMKNISNRKQPTIQKQHNEEILPLW